jgi:hypothetical protein
MNNDLTDLLSSWKYDPEQTVRIIVADDGRSVLQVRLPLGIEQYEMQGRPDGHKPSGFATMLAALEERLRRHVVDHGNDAEFRIGNDDAAALHTEGVLFYYRYLLLYQLQYFDLVVSDTQHNINLCDMLERYCDDEEARNAILQFRPYIIRMNAAAKIQAVENGEWDGDVDEIAEHAIQWIESLDEIDRPAFQFERVRSTNYLRALLKKMRDDHASEPDTVTGELEKQLHEAIEREDYERAARLRDEIRRVDKER